MSHMDLSYMSAMSRTRLDDLHAAPGMPLILISNLRAGACYICDVFVAIAA